MFGKGEPVDLQIRDLEADIVRVRVDQVTLQFQLEDAVTAELRGMALADGARAVQARCRRMVEEHAQAISSLQDEIAALLPPQPGPTD